MAALSFLLLWIGFISILSCSCAEYSLSVPVFLWSKDSELSGGSPVLAGHTIKGSEFQERYLDKLFEDPQVIGVFLQDRLSIDDVSRFGDAYIPGNHGAAFSNLKVAMETANSTVVLPSVEDRISDELVYLIRKKTNGLVKEFTHIESGSFDIKEFSLEQDKTNVFIFHLMPTSSSKPEDVFAQNDKLIGALTNQISSTGLPYSCILTAAAPSEDIQERHLAEERSTVVHDRLRRAVDENIASANIINGSLFVDADCIMMYSKGLAFKVNESHDIFKIAGLECSVTPYCKSKNTTDRVEIKCKASSVKQFDLSFSFLTNGSSGEWRCIEASLDVNGRFGNETISRSFSYNCGNVLMGPTRYSYSCASVKLLSNGSSITFNQFQIQPFNVQNGTFAYAYDCTGFFTIPIFMGLITAGVLLLILFVGILAMFSLTTMDRFDDPKGPAIHVPTG